MPNREIKDQRLEGDDATALNNPVVGDLGDMTPTDEGGVRINPLLLEVSQEDQELLVAIIKEDYKNALEARDKTDWGTDKYGKGVDFETKYADLISLYEGEDVVRPEKWMCGRSLKIAQAIVEMLVARLLPAVWNEDTVRWRPVEFTDKRRVARANKIMDWVIRTWMKMGKDIGEIIRSCIMLGTVYVESFWDVKKKDLDLSETVPVTDENGQQFTDPLSGQPMAVERRLLEVIEKPAVKIIPVTRLLTQPGCTDIQKEPIIKLEDFYYHELEQLQREGLMENVTDELKNSVDKSLRDKFGAELEKAEKIADVEASRRMHLVECAVWYGNFDADKDGFAEEVCVMMALKEEVFLRAFKTVKVQRKGERPIRQINFINRIHKLLGIGVLEQVKPLAEEIDACFWQLQDANTLSILRWGFYDPNSDYDPSEHVAKPRAMYPVTNPSQNVYFPDINIPIERLLNAIRLVMEFVERLTAASSYIMGKESDIVGGSGTATRTAAIVNSAQARFNLPTYNMREGLAQVLTDIFNLCFLNMPEGLEKRILGEDGQPLFDSSEVIEDAFLHEMDAHLPANPSFGDANTERELAVLLYDKFVMGGNPLIVSDVGRLWHATANIFKAYGEDPAEWIGQPPSKKATNDPEKEQTMFRQGEIIHAEPQENHLEHILVHKKLLEGTDPDVLLWPKESLEMLRMHIQEHMQLMQALIAFQQNQKKGDALANQTAEPGRPAGNGGAAPTTPEQSGVQSDANPAQGTPTNQATGTTSGTPQVR